MINVLNASKIYMYIKILTLVIRSAISELTSLHFVIHTTD